MLVFACKKCDTMSGAPHRAIQMCPSYEPVASIGTKKQRPKIHMIAMHFNIIIKNLMYLSANVSVSYERRGIH
jgi:hypothetical protein